MEMSAGLRSLSDLQCFIDDYSKRNHVNLYITDSKTLAQALKRGTKRAKDANDRLFYYYVKYCCVSGGRKFVSRAHKRKTRTYKHAECPMFLKFLLSSDGQSLVLVSKCEEHMNHAQDEMTFAHHPNQRRLQHSDKEAVIDMLRLGANKRLVKNHIENKTSKIVTMKDIRNLQRYLKENKLETSEDLVNTIKKHFSNVDVTVVCDWENTFKGVFVQDRYMKDAFHAYPEVVMLDATHKLNDCTIPLHIMAVEDGEGETDIVAFWLMAREDEETLREVLEVFVRNNSRSDSIRTFITDQDVFLRKVLKEYFPLANFLISLFHVQESFRRDVTMENMQITAQERDAALKQLDKLIHAESVSMYDEAVNELITLQLENATEYFMTSWANLKEEWALAFQSNVLHFGNRTNNRIESLNSKVKQIVQRYPLKDFFRHFKIFLETTRDKRYRRPEVATLKSSAVTDIYLQDYQKQLTKYAYHLVQQQFEKRYTIDIEKYDTVEESCTCPFYTQYGLACKHILVLRERLNLPHFAPDACLARWYLCQDKELQLPAGVTEPSRPSDSRPFVPTLIYPKKQPVYTAAQKYNATMELCKQLAEIASKSGTKKWQGIMDKLHQFIHDLQGGKALIIDSVNKDRNHALQGTDFQGVDLLNLASHATQSDGNTAIDGTLMLTQEYRAERPDLEQAAISCLLNRPLFTKSNERKKRVKKNAKRRCNVNDKSGSLPDINHPTVVHPNVATSQSFQSSLNSEAAGCSTSVNISANNGESSIVDHSAMSSLLMMMSRMKDSTWKAGVGKNSTAKRCVNVNLGETLPSINSTSFDPIHSSNSDIDSGIGGTVSSIVDFHSQSGVNLGTVSTRSDAVQGELYSSNSSMNSGTDGTATSFIEKHANSELLPGIKLGSSMKRKGQPFGSTDTSIHTPQKRISLLKPRLNDDISQPILLEDSHVLTDDLVGNSVSVDILQQTALMSEDSHVNDQPNNTNLVQELTFDDQ